MLERGTCKCFKHSWIGRNRGLMGDIILGWGGCSKSSGEGERGSGIDGAAVRKYLLNCWILRNFVEQKTLFNILMIKYFYLTVNSKRSKVTLISMEISPNHSPCWKFSLSIRRRLYRTAVRKLTSFISWRSNKNGIGEGRQRVSSAHWEPLSYMSSIWMLVSRSKGCHKPSDSSPHSQNACKHQQQNFCWHIHSLVFNTLINLLKTIR